MITETEAQLLVERECERKRRWKTLDFKKIVVNSQIRLCKKEKEVNFKQPIWPYTPSKSQVEFYEYTVPFTLLLTNNNKVNYIGVVAATGENAGQCYITRE